MGTENILGQAYLGLGELYKSWGKNEAAEEYLTKAIWVFERTQATGFLSKAKKSFALLPRTEARISHG